MKKNLFILLSFLLLSLLFINATTKAPTPTYKVNEKLNLQKLTRAGIEAQIGNKFIFKECNCVRCIGFAAHLVSKNNF